ncbi:phage head spike fiber domain-containing protein [Salinibacter ruber]|uniref:Uncharacterized protein n=1 Tax=Salinibacter ruber TaxID=146919 RepID=A0AAW5P8Y3_9BACT|nr:hypothetical protein [Salinibacter ruber]MCS4157666.1 hypothetical protein [Salinibacter ruber]
MSKTTNVKAKRPGGTERPLSDHSDQPSASQEVHARWANALVRPGEYDLTAYTNYNGNTTPVSNTKTEVVLPEPWRSVDLSANGGNVQQVELLNDDIWDECGLTDQDGLKINPSFDLDFREGVVPQKVKDHHTRTSKATVLGADGNWKEVPAGEVAIHHDPVTGQRMGWFEKEHTNLVDAGRDLSSSGWNLSNVTVPSTSKTGIDGQSAASELEDADSNNAGSAIFNTTVPDDNNGVTYIAFIKKASSTNATVEVRGSIFGNGSTLEASIVFDPVTGDYIQKKDAGAVEIISTPGWWWVLVTVNNDNSGSSNSQIQISPAWATTVDNVDEPSATGSIIIDGVTMIRHGPAAEDGNGYADEVYRAHPIFTGPPDYSVGTRTRAADEINGMPVDWPTGVTSGGMFEVSQYAAGEYDNSQGGVYYKANLNLGPSDNTGQESGLTGYFTGVKVNGVDTDEDGVYRVADNTDVQGPNNEEIEELQVIPDMGSNVNVNGASFGIRRIAAHPAPLSTSQKNHLEQKPKLLRNLEVFVDYNNWSAGEPLPNRVRGTWADEFGDVNSVQASTSDSKFGLQSGQYLGANSEEHAREPFPSHEGRDVYAAAWITVNTFARVNIVQKSSFEESGWGLRTSDTGDVIFLKHDAGAQRAAVAPSIFSTGETVFIEGWFTNSNKEMHARLDGGSANTQTTNDSMLDTGQRFCIGKGEDPGDVVVHQIVVEYADPSKGESLQWPSADPYNSGNGFSWNDVITSSV